MTVKITMHTISTYTIESVGKMKIFMLQLYQQYCTYLLSILR